MFIVRWLMSHPILFAWALAALAIILNWGTKSGVDHAEPADVAAVHSQQTSDAKDAHADTNAGNTKAAQQAAVKAHTPASPEQPVVPTAPENELQKPAVPEKPGMDAALGTETVKAEEAPQKVEQATDAAANNTVEVVSVEETTQVGDTIEQVSVTVVDVGGAAEIAETKGAEASTSTSEVVETSSGSDADAKAPEPTDTKAASPDELLKLAREAFWHNKKDEAASIYKQLIEMQPEVLEHKGELGNVYWHQNKQKESAALYAEIAIPLIKKGNSAQVENMLGFIGAFYPEKATEIHQYLLNNQ